MDEAADQQHRACLLDIGGGGAAREQAVARLYRSFRAPLLAFFRRNGIAADLAEDLLQDVFIRITQRADTFRGEAQAGSWIWAIARNRLIDHIRERSPELLLDDDGWAVVGDAAAQPEPASDVHSLERCVQRAFMRFGRGAGDRAEALRRVVLDGWEVADVAVFLGRTVRATHEYLSQTRKKFAPFLEECREFMAS